MVGLFPDGRFVPRWTRWLVVSFLLFVPFFLLLEPGDIPIGFGTTPIAVLTLTIAMMRYRLYEIDILVNRTLVYGGLSISLALFYFLSVALLQTILAGESPVAIVISTLGIAAIR